VPPPHVRVSDPFRARSTAICGGGARAFQVHTKILPFWHFVPRPAPLAFCTYPLYTPGAICQIGGRA